MTFSAFHGLEFTARKSDYIMSVCKLWLLSGTYIKVFCIFDKMLYTKIN